MGIAAAATLIGILAAPMKGRLFLGKRNALQNDPHLADQHFIELCNLFAEPESVHSDPGSCGFRAKKGKPMVYLVGDSHIHQFRHAIATYSAENGFGLHGVWGNSCPFPDLPSFAFPSDSRTQFCQRQQRALASKLLGAVRPGDIVFIGDYLTTYFLPANAGPAYKDAIRDYSSKLHRISEDLIAEGATVVIYLNAPRFDGLEGISEGYCFPQ